MTPFADDRFVAGLAAVFGWSVVPMDTSAGLRALLVERKTGLFSEYVVPPFSPFSALRCDNVGWDTVEIGLLELGARIVASGKPALLALEPDWSARFPGMPGWSRQERHTYILDTAEPDVILSNSSASTRRLVRKHADDYRIESDATHVPAVIELVSGAYGRHGRSLPGNPDRIRDLCDLMIRAGKATAYTAVNRSTGAIEAGMVVLQGSRMAYYWLTGSEPGPAMSVLIPAVGGLLKANGTDRFDLMGANTPSIAEFKRRFGADLVSYTHLRCTGRGMSSLIARVRNRRAR